ncbi:low temperature requirement protein A [Limosilactobacillus sp. STM2_1]|uniref:Low temperature requirement protein A n=1 Tax=Limosilactobacillus rudii TaxID=2759755 RepID=A0A7W3UKH5_9LACO|nr:low temperature requirement protein A [Limosilactobacillus rudii]MBB1078475.1 low temperature requirement protein A [Limosilactobacillus rudii]MBB1096605.1 low temperature requirement protein A [Limosilactobacillus rudii]MCD7134199.1 low temperature requirement protein A [Limosilactobacillus rudii]
MVETLTKRVSLVELFYDLVFVYMVSRATELLHHLHNGVLNSSTIVIFILVIVVFINSWMVQMVFTNRYGKSSWTNIMFSFVDMAIVLYMSNAFTATFDRRLETFFIAAGLLSLTLCLQYLITFFQVKTEIDKKIAVAFTGILGFRTIVLLIGGLFYNSIGITIALVGIIISWITPAFTGKYTKHHPIIFSHLLERLTALIIVMFGETIVGIADYFTQESLSLSSIFIFMIVVGLFFTYIVEFDHLIDEHRQQETGNLLIYLHYFIIFGLSLVTVALKFINEPAAKMPFAISVLYFGIGLFYIGLAIANYYNYPHLQVNWLIRISFILTVLLGYGISLNIGQFNAITVIAAIVIIVNAGVLVQFLNQRMSLPS